MPFIPTPIVGALVAINATRKNQQDKRSGNPAPEKVEKERSAFKSLFFGPGKA